MNNELVITKADQGSCLVILNKSDNISKVESFLYQNNIKCVTNNPLPKFITQIKHYIKTCIGLYTLYDKKFNSIPSNPFIPHLYGLPRIHKLAVPISPTIRHFVLFQLSYLKLSKE